jgi:DNA polymerase/3'-5' exonuclease PolX
MDFKETILRELDVLRKKEQQDKQVFKARAYSKVISQIQTIDGPVRNWDDIANIKGIGEKIHDKIEEIFKTGTLEAAAKIRKERPIETTDMFMKIYGVGPVKARELVEKHKMKSLEDLRNHPELLNDKQKIGLKYVEDLMLRIPRLEMLEHEKLLLTRMKAVHKDFEGQIVGSFRRGAKDSGDIDVLMRLPDKYDTVVATELFAKYCTELQNMGYITDILALGPKKCMGVCRLENGKARRIDLLLTPTHEYAFALLYFTGSDKYNVAMRKHALEKGYTMNEHGMKPIKENVPEVPVMKEERDIFNFLEYPYSSPSQRDGKKIV